MSDNHAPENDPSPAAVEATASPAQPATVSPGRAGQVWREWIRPLLLVLAVMGSFRSALADWNDVPSGSMKPTILEGDRIFVNKAAYDLRIPFTRKRLARWSAPERGDIVVLFSPEDSKRLVKRVVGLPGDRLKVTKGRLFINDQPLTYQRLESANVAVLEPAERQDYRFWTEKLGEHDHQMMLPSWPANREDFGPVEVPADHFFVMGDNRGNSRDSRYFGFVERGAVVGKATGVVFSLDMTQCVIYPLCKPRWNRFFHGLT